MSDIGHAMFTVDHEQSSFYGVYGWILDSKYCVPIHTLQNDIATLWDADRADMFDGAPYIVDVDYYMQFDGKFIAASFDPDDIVDSARAWDSPELTTWFWERIAEPRNIMAVSTSDGAICFDPDLIVMVHDADKFTNTKYLADCYGCKPDELEIYLYDGEHVVTDYRLMD